MKIRIKFTKTGSMKFIGHLDVMRYFQKALRRSGMDVAYSQGYNPHQLISFAAPLGVGLTSDGEYMDMQLNQTDSSEEAIKRLNAVMNEEIRVKSYVQLPEDSKPAMSIVAAADYCISVKDGYECLDQYEQLFDAFLTQDQIMITKKTKKSQKEMDVKPYIYYVAYTEEAFEQQTGTKIAQTVAESYENGKKIYMQIATGSVVNIKPDVIIEAFCKYAGIPYEKFAYQVHRRELYADLHANPKLDVSEYGRNRKLVSLEQLGQVI